MSEEIVIQQLREYRQKEPRLQALSSYNIGAGLTVSRLNEDDQLQDLHRKLRGLPSYMYLNKREQMLETTAHAYLTRYPAGVRSQLRAVESCQPADEEDGELLQELRGKIKKVLAARGYEVRGDIDAVLERVAELQDLQAEINRIDTVLRALDNYNPEYATLLKVHIIDNRPWDVAAKELGVSKTVFYRLRKNAISEYEKIGK